MSTDSVGLDSERLQRHSLFPLHGVWDIIWKMERLIGSPALKASSVTCLTVATICLLGQEHLYVVWASS